MNYGLNRRELKTFTKRVKRAKLSKKVKQAAIRNAYRFYNTERLVTRASKR